MADPMNASIVTHFQSLEDPRIERTKKPHLLDMLVIALCTLLTGGEGFQDMELFGRSKRTWLQTFLTLPHGIPSHDTFGRVFARLNPRCFQECFLSWTQAVAQLTHGALVGFDHRIGHLLRLHMTAGVLECPIELRRGRFSASGSCCGSSASNSDTMA